MMNHSRKLTTGALRSAIIIWLCGVVLSWIHAAPPRPALGVDIQTTVDSDSVTVGERLHIRYVIDHSDSLELLPLTAIETGSCHLISIRFDEEKQDRGKRKIATIEVFTLDLEEAHLPGAELRFLTPSGDTLYAVANDVTVPVRSLVAAGGELKPLKDPWEAPFDYLPVIIAAVAAVALASALYLLWRNRKRRILPEVLKPELPPDFVALMELTRIEGLKLLDEGEFKKYYTLVTDAIRKYIEKRFGIDAMDCTTGEILLNLNAIRRRVDHLEELLREADLVKFAKFIPGIEAGKRAMKTARGIVVRTTPASEPDPEVKVSVGAAGNP
ncbi:MAG: hypothetical protein GTO51_02495 [Candidatus Latescibacteria bacterium]|nr:hypothetical protein [Candidatus Latescibacterota bacterium]NIM22530.1 hypothetical protein [Candidatus Latescibacterota bacterium]NIM64844.1 hypothetical protein [Candidatus Latescibacterota bacterium]NIO01352.1 hypothetical protein [Candidatus Latescibacterota bacterium]NIO27841.1 hypothetical protein [Candidatus Latescibacterota bacterium]